MVNMSKRNVFIIVSYIATVVINILSQLLPFNGLTAAQVSDSMPNLFAPAGITFSIWGVIYCLLGVMVLYRIGVFKRKPGETITAMDDWLFVISCLANIAWIFCWHYGFILMSVIAIVILLIVLAIMFTRVTKKTFATGSVTWFVRIPISVYFGWITVATIANICAFLVHLGWDGFGISNQIWTMIVLILGAIIGILGTFCKESYAYGIVFIWSYAGILYKHLSTKYWDGKYMIVILTAVYCLIAFVIAEIVTMIKIRRRRKTLES